MSDSSAAPFVITTKRLFCTVDWRKQRFLRTPKAIARHFAKKFDEVFGQGTVEHLLVSLEHYNLQGAKDDLHIHLLLWCHQSTTFSSVQLDEMFGKHGHYKSADDNVDLIFYICKDRNWACHSWYGDSKRRWIKKLLSRGSAAYDVGEQYAAMLKRSQAEVQSVRDADRNGFVTGLLDNITVPRAQPNFRQVMETQAGGVALKDEINLASDDDQLLWSFEQPTESARLKSVEVGHLFHPVPQLARKSAPGPRQAPAFIPSLLRHHGVASEMNPVCWIPGVEEAAISDASQVLSPEICSFDC